jgi:hypothetical protein
MKKTLATLTFVMIMTLSSTFAHAGLLLSDRPATDGGIAPCNAKASTGIIIESAIFGIIIERAGIIIESPGIIIEKASPCSTNTKKGIIIENADPGIIIE